AVPTAGIGMMLTGLAHAVGWPVVAGGSARITDALAPALTGAGGSIETGRWVRSLSELPSATAVLLDVSPRTLALLAGDRLPVRYRAALRRIRMCLWSSRGSPIRPAPRRASRLCGPIVTCRPAPTWT